MRYDNIRKQIGENQMLLLAVKAISEEDRAFWPNTISTL